ncbi:flavin reductase family protein [Leucobacter sp. W1038]|jgi:flavin reductase (DIM6/NTAB) family NADH-FMN oxidoreductase RutF|uniref:flavin reductase family protein n=1 Tax=unclassified Leucobacter TaxID=2621730 RepID=UPI003D98A053
MNNNDVFLPASPEVFRSAMADLPAAVSLVTTRDADGTPRGATVSAISSLSLDPPLLLVCLDQSSDTLAALSEGSPLMLHIAADGQQQTALSLSRKGEQKFDQIAWTADAHGLPLIEGFASAFRCVVESLLPGGDHTIVVARISDIAQAPANTPIVYHRRQMLPSPAAMPAAA